MGRLMAPGTADPLSRGSAGGLPRICVVIDSFYPLVGGGETYARNITGRLRRMGAEAFVLTRRVPRGLPPVAEIDGVPIVRVPPASRGRLAKYLAVPFYAAALLAHRRRYNLIYVSNFRVNGVISVIVAKLLRKRCILRAGILGELSGGYMAQAGGLARRAWPLFSGPLAARQALLRSADGFVSNCEAVSEEFRRCGVPEEKIVWLPGGVDVERFRPAEAALRAQRRRALGLPQERFLIGYSGKLNRGKGLEHLIAALPALLARCSDAHLVLIGGGANQFLSQEDALRAQVRGLGCDARVTFTGYVRNVEEYLQSLDLFAFPTEREALPNALMEAMASGLPCVASRVGGIPDLIEDGVSGRLIEPGDVEALARTLAELREDPALAARLAVAARRTIESRYSLDDLARRHAELFESIVTRRSVHPRGRVGAWTRERVRAFSVHAHTRTRAHALTRTPEASRGQLRLLIVTGRCLPAVGGSQVFYNALSRFLAAQGAEVTLIATRMARGTVLPEQPHRVVCGPSLRESLGLVRRADIVHMNDFNYLWWALAKLFGKKTVIVYHTAARICPKGVGWNGREACSFETHWRSCLGCLRQDRSLAAAAWKWVSLPIKQRLADRSDAIVNYSKYTERRFKIPGSRTILHGIDLRRSRPAASPSGDFFLFVGRLVPVKGCDVAIRAVARCAAEGHPRPLVVAGDGPERPALEALARELGVAHLVRFCGELTGEALLAKQQQALALLMPVVWAETWGRAAVEAMACGTPVVASSIGALEDLVGEAGLLAPPGDAEALARQMLRLIREPALREQLRQAGLRLAARYSIDDELAQYLELYQSLLGGSVTRHRVDSQAQVVGIAPAHSRANACAEHAHAPTRPRVHASTHVRPGRSHAS